MSEPGVHGVRQLKLARSEEQVWKMMLQIKGLEWDLRDSGKERLGKTLDISVMINEIERSLFNINFKKGKVMKEWKMRNFLFL